MSLINKMLQDLDARGTQGAGPQAAEIRPVARPERRLPLPVLLVSLCSALALGAGGYAALKFFQNRAAAPAPAVKVAAEPMPAPKPVIPAAPVVPDVPAPVAEVKPEPEPAKPVAPVEVKPAKVKVKPVAAKPKQEVAKKAPAKRVLPAAAVKKAAVPAKPLAQIRPPPKPLAADQYRVALARMSEGRVTEAIASLEQTLRTDPRHEGARQTLVGLLIENGRHDDAMRHLQAALALDVRQPSMAVLLARLQIERGGNGIDTLMRSLPAAAGKPDYHAFLAGALQRAGRHGEAAEQYMAALRTSPQNGVWLMGLGISLMAEHRNADAAEAFKRAKASGNLSAQLQNFVERKLNQLAQ